MELRIEPEPDEAERRAILEAVDGAAAEESSSDPYRSRWRLAGILESLDASDEG